MSGGAEEQGDLVVGDRFVVDTRAPGRLLGGLESFPTRDRQASGGRYVALRVPRAIPARGRFTGVPSVRIEGLIQPQAMRLVAGYRWYVIESPICPPIFEAAREAAMDRRPWGEAEIFARLLRPVGHTLTLLHDNGVTHRAIRADNVFGSLEHPAVLGPCSATAPAWAQDARYEPPSMAVCAPQARGEGSIADDVYALGVLALALHLGREPLAGIDPTQIIARKLEIGSFLTLIEDERISTGLLDVLRLMLADDPDQRLTPATLAEMSSGRERRGIRRVTPRAQRAFEIGGVHAWNTRMLAWGLAQDTTEGARILRSGAVSHWLRRSAEAQSMAARLDEFVAGATVDPSSQDIYDSLLVMHAAALFDPGAPMLWEGTWLWPNAIGAMLCHAAREAVASGQGNGVKPPPVERIAGGKPPPKVAVQVDPIESLRRAIRFDAVARWATLLGRPMSRVDPGGWLQIARNWLGEPGGDAMLRLLYVLNPMQACKSPHLEDAAVLSPAEVVEAFETRLREGRTQDGPWIDDHLAAFLMTRDDAAALWKEDEVIRRHPVLRDLVRLAGLQRRWRGAACPALAQNQLPLARRVIERWPGQSQRLALSKQIDERVGAGDLPGILALVTNEQARARGERLRQAAMVRVAELRAHIERLSAGREHFGARSRRLAGEIGVGAGMVAVAAAALAELLA